MNNMKPEMIQIAPRIPKPMRKQLKHIAVEKEISLNQLVVQYLQDGINKDRCCFD